MKVAQFPVKPQIRPSSSQQPPAPPSGHGPAHQPQPEDQVSFSQGAFVDGVSAGAELIADTTGLVVGGAVGLSLGATAAALAVAGLGISAGPLATGLVLLGVGAGAVLGAGTGASVLDKFSHKVGQWGSKLASKVGLSEKAGEAVGRASLALALTAPMTLTLATGGTLSFAPIAGALLLAGGLANKAVMGVADLIHGKN